jgi:hypothetical protein
MVKVGNAAKQSGGGLPAVGRWESLTGITFYMVMALYGLTTKKFRFQTFDGPFT